MANIKKHAILIPVGFGRTLTWDDTSGVIPGNWDVKKNEITFRTINADSQSQLNFTYTIAIRDEEEIIDGQPPVALLNAMSAEVGRVLTDTEAECQRVGFIP
jgi:hypothetical protein